MDEIIELINKTASGEINWDGSDPMNTIYDISGGNYDDAYYAGSEDGEIAFARRLKNMLDKLSE